MPTEQSGKIVEIDGSFLVLTTNRPMVIGTPLRIRVMGDDIDVSVSGIGTDDGGSWWMGSGSRYRYQCSVVEDGGSDSDAVAFEPGSLEQSQTGYEVLDISEAIDLRSGDWAAAAELLVQEGTQ